MTFVTNSYDNTFLHLDTCLLRSWNGFPAYYPIGWRQGRYCYLYSRVSIGSSIGKVTYFSRSQKQ